MATQGTQKVLGGTQYRRYSSPPVVGIGNSLGLYPWSVFKAPLCTWDGTNNPVAQGNLNFESVINLLLFTSDVPAFLELRVTDSDANLQFANNCTNILEVPFLVTTKGGTTPSTITVQGKVASGYTGALAEVYCTGFPAVGHAVPPGAEGVASYTEAICIANAPVIASPVSSMSLDFKQNKDNTFAGVPILISYDTYTAAVRDAGNLITAFDGSLYKVVGLWGGA